MAQNKKGALVPQWDESACFRGATHFQRPAGRPSFCLLLREGDRARLRARWWDCLRPLLAVGRLQPVASLSVRRCWGLLMTRRGGERNNSIPQWGKSQPFSPVFAEKRGGASRTRPAASRVILSAAKDPLFPVFYVRPGSGETDSSASPQNDERGGRCRSATGHRAAGLGQGRMASARKTLPPTGGKVLQCAHWSG